MRKWFPVFMLLCMVLTACTNGVTPTASAIATLSPARTNTITPINIVLPAWSLGKWRITRFIETFGPMKGPYCSNTELNIGKELEISNDKIIFDKRIIMTDLVLEDYGLKTDEDFYDYKIYGAYSIFGADESIYEIYIYGKENEFFIDIPETGEYGLSAFSLYNIDNTKMVFDISGVPFSLERIV